MRRHCLLFLFAIAIGLIPVGVFAQEYAQLRAKPIIEQEFSGSGSTTTGFFKMRDRWEVQWNARQVVSVAVMSADGSIVAGAAGVLRGSLFVPLGGQYYLKISDGTVIVPDTSPPPASTNTNAPSASTNGIANTNAPVPNSTAPPPPEPAASWHVKVVQLGKTVRASQSLTVFTPYFIVPDSAITPEPPPPPPPVLTTEQAQTIVRIHGDKASGSGFLLRTPEGGFVVTALHLLAGNPNIHLTTTSGTEITTLGLKGAIDRDLAMYTVQDQNFSYLPPCTDSADKIKTGEPLIIPDIAGQTDPMIGKPGQVIGISAGHVDFDNPMSAENSGAPVILAKKGTALAIVTAVSKSDLSDEIAAAWPGNPPPGSSRIIPYFGLRLTGILGWQSYDPQQFLIETNFLQQFHRDTRCLDSFLNGRKEREPGEDENTGPPDIHFYVNNAKLNSSFETYRHFANDADNSQRMEAAHELLFDLYGVADTDVATLQGMTNLYAYDQNRAKEELAYRAAIRKELDFLGDNLRKLDILARSRLQP